MTRPWVSPDVLYMLLHIFDVGYRLVTVNMSMLEFAFSRAKHVRIFFKKDLCTSRADCVWLKVCGQERVIHLYGQERA